MTTAEELRREGMIEGEKIGEERGEKRGEKKGKVAVVKNALNMGLAHDQIVQLTGLSSDEIEKIAQDVKDN